MAGASITATFEGAEIRRALSAWTRAGRDATPMLRAIGSKMAANVRDRIADAVEPSGAPFAALSPAYAAIKKGPGILRESGMRGGLQGSITFDASADQLVIGSNKVYAAIHQFGGTIRAKTAGGLRFRLAGGEVRRASVTIPARPYLGVSAEDEDAILDTAEVFLLRAR